MNTIKTFRRYKMASARVGFFGLPGLVVATTLAALSPSTASAVGIYGTAVTGADLTDSRSTGGSGLVSSGVKWNAANLATAITVAWNISFSAGMWNYAYTWSGTRNAGMGGATPSIVDDISHFTLDITDTCVVGNALAGGCTFSDFSPSGMGFDTEFKNSSDGITGALKFDFGATTYSFKSNQAPVWRDLCLVDGDGSADCPVLPPLTTGTSLVWNSGFNDRDSMETSLYIAGPNGVNGTVPEPATLALMGLGLAGIGWRRKVFSS